MSATMRTRTQAERQEVARRARQHGHFAKGPTGRAAYLFCPLCKQQIDAYRHATNGRLETMSRALDRAVLEHLNNPDGDGCPGVDRSLDQRRAS